MHGFRTAKNRYLKRGFLSQLGVIFQMRRLKSKSFNTPRGSSQYSEQARVYRACYGFMKWFHETILCIPEFSEEANRNIDSLDGFCAG